MQALFQPKPIDKVDEKWLREFLIVKRAEALKLMGYWLPPKVFAARRAMFNAKESGGYLHEVPAKRPDATTQMLSGDPSFLTNMMARNLQNILPNMAMFGFVNAFFTGFVMGKVPFPLTHKFRAMLQGGMDLPYLDVTYISSLSYFFMLMFGSNKILSLVLREVSSGETEGPPFEYELQNSSLFVPNSQRMHIDTFFSLLFLAIIILPMEQDVEGMSAASMNPMMGMMGGGGGGGGGAASAHTTAVLEAHVTQSRTIDVGKAYTVRGFCMACCCIEMYTLCSYVSCAREMGSCEGGLKFLCVIVFLPCAGPPKSARSDGARLGPEERGGILHCAPEEGVQAQVESGAGRSGARGGAAIQKCELLRFRSSDSGIRIRSLGRHSSA